MRTRKLLVAVAVSALFLCACDVKDPIYEAATTGKVTFVTDWANRTDGIDIPSSYTVVVNGQALTLTETIYTMPEVEAGTYSVLIYNTAEKITQDGTIASVHTTGDVVDPLPGWLFTYTEELTLMAGEERTVTARMKQQVRLLFFELNITNGNPESLQSVTASLSGVANGMNVKTNTYMGAGLKVIPQLTREDNKMEGAVRLIGLTSEGQQLTLDITYTSGRIQQIITDISTGLTGFNDNKHNKMTLTVDMEITRQVGSEATINKWEVKEGSSGIAW